MLRRSLTWSFGSVQETQGREHILVLFFSLQWAHGPEGIYLLCHNDCDFSNITVNSCLGTMQIRHTLFTYLVSGPVTLGHWLGERGTDPCEGFISQPCYRTQISVYFELLGLPLCSNNIKCFKGRFLLHMCCKSPEVLFSFYFHL